MNKLIKEQLDIHVEIAVEEFMSHGNRRLALFVAQKRIEDMGWEYEEKPFKRAFHDKIVEDLKEILA